MEYLNFCEIDDLLLLHYASTKKIILLISHFAPTFAFRGVYDFWNSVISGVTTGSLASFIFGGRRSVVLGTYFGLGMGCCVGLIETALQRMSPDGDILTMKKPPKFDFDSLTDELEVQLQLNDVIENVKTTPLDIQPPKNIKAKDIDCKIDKNKIKIGLKGTKPFINEELLQNINEEESTWYMDKNELIIVLIKVNIGEIWNGVLKKQNELNSVEIEETKKQLMLERFQREHPTFDFSNAQFNGQCPDPQSFLDGINEHNLN